MPLRPLSDVSAADWFVDSEADWWTKVCLGPPGYDAYARVHFDPDEQPPDDHNNLLGPTLRSILATHTTTPDDCFFALWDGWGGFEGGPQDTGARWAVKMPASYEDLAEARRLTAEAKLVDYAPAFDPAFLHGPKVTVPNRAYYLFGGPLSPDVDWGAADYSADLQRHYTDEPALLWPADHAWFAAKDVDPDWVGVAGTQALIDVLVADARLDVAPSTYDATDWEDR